MNRKTRLNKEYRFKTLRELGQKCRERREAFNISVAEMAEFISVTPAYIYRFENGEMDSLYLYSAYQLTVLNDLSEGVIRKYGDKDNK